MAETPTRALPVFIVKKDTISPKDIRRMERLAHICVVESTDVHAVRLLEPPEDADVPAQARAALQLFRIVKDHGNTTFYRSDLTKWFLNFLMDAPPDRVERVKKVKA
jgi:hypothetical protein